MGDPNQITEWTKAKLEKIRDEYDWSGMIGLTDVILYDILEVMNDIKDKLGEMKDDMEEMKESLTSIDDTLTDIKNEEMIEEDTSVNEEGEDAKPIVTSDNP